MNDTTPPHGTSGPDGSSTGTPPHNNPQGGQQGGPQPFGSGFFAWLRRLRIVRGQERWFTGVAGGIAARAGIDPLIVRGLFVVLALLGGPGLLLYLAGWLLLPDSSGRIHAEEVIRGRASTGVIVTAAVIAGLVVIPVIFGLSLGGAPMLGTPSFWGWDLWVAMGLPLWLVRTAAWVFWIAVAVAAFFIIRHFVLQRGREHTSRNSDSTSSNTTETPTAAATSSGADPVFEAGSGTDTDQAAGAEPHPGTGSDIGAQARAFADRTEEFASRTSEQAKEWGTRTGQKASEWSAEVGRQADEWSARYAERHEAHKLGAAHTVLTLALALLAGGLFLFWSLGVGLPQGEPTRPALPWVLAAIAMLAVLGLSLIVAGIRGRNTGFVGFLAACGVVALLFTAVLPWGTRFQPFGDIEITGTRDPGTVVIAGDADIDLRDLDTDPSQANDEIVVWQLAGTATVTLPDDAPSSVLVRVLAGNISENSAAHEGFRVSGPFLSHRSSSPATLPASTRNMSGTTSDATAESVPRVTVYLLAGNVRIVGGGSALVQDDRAGTTRERSDRNAREDLQRLEDDLAQTEWQIEEPGITVHERRGLEDKRDAIQDDIDAIEKELAR
ncbi:PspC domain-containing protein [Leucobacter sp. GX24907]